MPRVYNPRPSTPEYSFSRSRSPLDLAPTDADDAIVLDDLVRTGEASRLRRRGAIRPHHRAPLAPLPMPPAPADGSFDPILDLGVDVGFGIDWRGVDPDQDGDYFLLRCGAPLPPSPSFDESVSYGWTDYFRPSPLPQCAAQPSPPKRRKSRTPLTTGCGAVVHLCATGRTDAVFTARQRPGPCVAPMDAVYFEDQIQRQLSSSHCGCIREGVGCSVCGNVLGMRFKPCQSALGESYSSIRVPPLVSLSPSSSSSSLSSLSAVSPVSPSPNVTQLYTYPATSRSDSMPKLDSESESGSSSSSPQDEVDSGYLYTFFASNVSAEPKPLTAIPAPGRRSAAVIAPPLSPAARVLITRTETRDIAYYHGPSRASSPLASTWPGPSSYAFSYLGGPISTSPASLPVDLPAVSVTDLDPMSLEETEAPVPVVRMRPPPRRAATLRAPPMESVEAQLEYAPLLDQLSSTTTSAPPPLADGERMRRRSAQSLPGSLDAERAACAYDWDASDEPIIPSFVSAAPAQTSPSS